MIGEGKISAANRLLVLREERRDGYKIQDVANNSILKGLVEGLEASDFHLILHAKNTGSSMSV